MIGEAAHMTKEAMPSYLYLIPYKDTFEPYDKYDDYDLNHIV